MDGYLHFFESFPTLMWRSGVDKKCNYFNKRWLEFTGRTMEQELGDGWADGVHPEDLDQCFKTYVDAFDQRISFEMEYRLRRYDGEYRWILDARSPFYDLKGVFAGYLGSVNDITERKNTELCLERYKIFSEKARDIILFLDLNGNILDANESALDAYGYSKEEITQLSLFDIRENKEVTMNQMLQADHQGIYFETSHIRKDGSFFPVEVSSTGASMGDKRVLVSIIRDISPRKKVEQQLIEAKDCAEAANEAKSEFLANMSHEIRTPLNGMVGMIDITLTTDLTEEQKENLTIAKSCTASLLVLINDILDFSKMEAGKLNIENICFNLKQLIEDIIKSHALLAKQKGLELNYMLSARIPEVLMGDPNRLKQVLNNLINNAIKFTEMGSIIVMVKCVRITEEHSELLFSISDTGIGIASTKINKLFKSFSQVDGSHTRKYGGTGLGLVISKQLVELMGGTISVESEIDKGSIFSFMIKFH